jgi:hypothetical protein
MTADKRLVEIEHCCQCHHNGIGMGVGTRRCKKNGSLIKDLVFGFPESCPLEKVAF